MILWDIYKILRWHKRTFPLIDAKQQETKLAEEIKEYRQAIDDVIKHQRSCDILKAQYELADIVIASINLMRFQEIRKRVEIKMWLNRKRKWENNHHK